jgi:glucose/arabinose dehydrogenase
MRLALALALAAVLAAGAGGASARTAAAPGFARIASGLDSPLYVTAPGSGPNRSTYGNHNGGLLVAAPDRRLYVSIGDGGSGGDPDDNGQNLATKLGKLLSLDLRRPSAGWRLVALGLRNPWRYSFDRQTGDLYIGDVGQDRWEEVDVVRAGDSLMNLGWSVYEGRAPYKDQPLAGFGKLVAPVYVYGHDRGRCAITGGYVYRGSAVPSLRGRYFFGDYCTGEIWTMQVVNGKATDVRPFGTPLPQLDSFGEDSAGELYAVTLSGSIYRLHG